MPLSIDQQRLWSVHLRLQDPSSLHIPLGFSIKGEFDKTAWLLAIAFVRKRHEMLRCGYANEHNRLVVLPEAGHFYPIDEIDFSHRPKDQTAELVNAEIQKLAARSFDFKGESLFRAVIIRIDASHFVLVFIFHHLIIDAISLTKFSKEISVAYNSFLQGKEPDLPPVEAQFSEFCRIERDKNKRQTEAAEKWKALLRLAEPQEIQWTTGQPQEAQIGFHAFSLDKDAFGRLNQKAIEYSVNPYFLVMSALGMSIKILTSCSRFVLTTAKVLSAKKEFRHTLGLFTSPSLIPLHFPSNKPYVEIVKELEKNWQLQQLSRLTYTEEAALLGAPPNSCRLDQLFFSYINYPLPELPLDFTESKLMYLPRMNLDYDCFFTLHHAKDGLKGFVEFKTQAIARSFIEQLTLGMQQLLSGIGAGQLNTLADAFKILQKPRPGLLHLVGSFTLDPLRHSLNYWSAKLPYPFEWTQGGYQQIHSELLDPSSALRQNPHGLNVVLFRWEDCLHQRSQACARTEAILAENRKLIQSNGRAFLQALQEAAASGLKVPLLILVCPRTDTNTSDPDTGRILTELEQALSEFAIRTSNVYYLSSDELVQKSIIPLCTDPHREALAHIPYEDSFYFSIGTRIARFYFRYCNPSYKVLALDCDNTLWKGEVGDQGPLGIQFLPEHRVWHEKLKAAKNQGLLLAAVSKNHSDDVLQVFRQRKDFLLQESDFVAFKVSWEPKSHSLRDLARDLNISPSSIVFFDDNPMECFEVEHSGIGCAVWRVPADSAHLDQFYDKIWGLDALKESSVDLKRTQMYREELQRKEIRTSSSNLLEYIENLKILVRATPIQEQNIGRASQLTLRTNQFNNTCIRRKEGCLRELLMHPSTFHAVFSVEDAFGDYGEIGLLIANEENGCFSIDTFLLSCRALGRGVEYEMFQTAIEEASNKHLSSILILFKKCPRNQPIEMFLNDLQAFIPGSSKQEEGYHFSVQECAGKNKQSFLQWKEQQTRDLDPLVQEESAAEANIDHENYHNSFQKWVHEEEETLLRQATTGSARCEGPLDLKGMTAEEGLCLLCGRILGRAPILPTEDFFSDLGGESLDFINLLAAIEETFEISLPFHEVIQHPTPKRIAELLTKEPSQHRLSEGKSEPLPYLIDARCEIQIGTLPPPSANRNNLLLTGAAGNLGSYLLRELLLHTPYTIHCLVRSKGSTSGEERILRTMHRLGMEHVQFKDRIVVHEGDFATPLFGLEEHTYFELCHTIDTVFHCGAAVNFTHNYGKLRESNVSGMHTILAFSTTGTHKHLHYVSSNVVFDTSQNNLSRVFTEQELEDSHDPDIVGGYAQTKWVCEKLLQQVMKKGLAATVYRPAGILAAEDPSSHLSLEDVLNTYLIALLEMKSAPDILTHVNASPVDYVARALVSLSQTPDCKGKYFHLSHPSPIPFPHFVKLLEDIGYPIQLKPYSEWLRDLENYVFSKSKNPFLNILFKPLFKDKAVHSHDMTWMELALNRGHLDTTQTTSLLPPKIAPCPPLDHKAALKQLFLCFASMEIFEKPPSLLPAADLENTKIIILYANTGSGHLAKARLIQKELTARLPGTLVESIALETLSPLQGLVSEIYNYMLTQRPDLYSILHDLTNQITEEKYLLFEQHLESIAHTLLARHYPRLIISVHALASSLSGPIKHLAPDISFITLVTDWMGGFLKAWATQGADRIFCLSQRAKDYLLTCGAPPEKVNTIPLLLDQELYRVPSEDERLNWIQSYGLSPHKPVVLLNTTGKSRFKHILRQLRAFAHPLNLITLCYGSKELLEYCSDWEDSHHTLCALDWVDTMAQLIKITNIVITKPGPGISQEAYASGTLLLLDTGEAIMPQEKEVMQYLLDTQSAEVFGTFEELQPTLSGMLDRLHTLNSRKREPLEYPHAFFDYVVSQAHIQKKLQRTHHEPRK